jgi:hypothetical protein
LSSSRPIWRSNKREPVLDRWTPSIEPRNDKDISLVSEQPLKPS